MRLTAEEFFHDFRQELMAGAEANSTFQLAEFMGAISRELTETGFIEDFEFCHYRAQRGMRIDGYWFSEEDTLDLFIADFESRHELASLTQTDTTSTFKRLTNFFMLVGIRNFIGNWKRPHRNMGLHVRFLTGKI